MDKTLHRKLTEKHLYAYTPAITCNDGEMHMGLVHEVNMLREAAKDLMQPRPEAVANILRMAKGL